GGKRRQTQVEQQKHRPKREAQHSNQNEEQEAHSELNAGEPLGLIGLEPDGIFGSHGFLRRGGLHASDQVFGPLQGRDGITAWVCVTCATRRPSSSVMSVCTTMVVRPV